MFKAISDFVQNRDLVDYRHVSEILTMAFSQTEEFASMSANERSKIINCQVELNILIDRLIEAQKKKEKTEQGIKRG